MDEGRGPHLHSSSSLLDNANWGGAVARDFYSADLVLMILKELAECDFNHALVPLSFAGAPRAHLRAVA